MSNYHHNKSGNDARVSLAKVQLARSIDLQLTMAQVGDCISIASMSINATAI